MEHSMTRVHIRAMMCPRQGQGYVAALKVLKDRKALPKHFVYLEELRKEQLATERRAVTASDEEGYCAPGCGVCAVLGEAKSRVKRPQKRFAHSIQRAMVVR